MRLADITQYGGLTVMLPAAVVIGVWLWYCGSKRSTALWVATLLVVYTLVAASKILFKGWGVWLESLNLAVLSGHAMNTCLVLTVALSLLARQVNYRLRWFGAALGLSIGWWFATNCVAPFIHPLPEAIAGALLGSTAACVFLYYLESTEIRKIPRAVLALGLVFMAFNTTTTKYNAEHVLNRIAVAISGEEKVFVQPEWRTPAQQSQL